MWYSNDMFHHVLKAKFVIALKLLELMSFKTFVIACKF